jgi:hypothetical protein
LREDEVAWAAPQTDAELADRQSEEGYQAYRAARLRVSAQGRTLLEALAPLVANGDFAGLAQATREVRTNYDSYMAHVAVNAARVAAGNPSYIGPPEAADQLAQLDQIAAGMARFVDGIDAWTVSLTQLAGGAPSPDAASALNAQAGYCHAASATLRAILVDYAAARLGLIPPTG